MKIRFLCGCETGNIESRENLLTMDAITIDDEGMLTCTYHGARRYGWRSIPRSSNHPGPKTPYLSMTPAEIEGRIVFRDDFPTSRRLVIDLSNMENIRNNYDPETVYYEAVVYRKDRNGRVIERLPDEPGKGSALLERNRRE